MDETDQRVLRIFKDVVCRGFPGAKLTLFGSRARGDAKPESDMEGMAI